MKTFRAASEQHERAVMDLQALEQARLRDSRSVTEEAVTTARQRERAAYDAAMEAAAECRRTRPEL